VRDLERNLIAKIHLAKKDLGFDDDRYRALLMGVTGKSSCRDMTYLELVDVLDAFVKEGFVVTVKKKPSRSGKPETATRKIENTPGQKKIFKLWFLLADAGFTNRGARYLNAFIKKQTGIEAIEWVKSANDERAVIEALKGWAKNKGVTLK
jgi:phage gp16-like protein